MHFCTMKIALGGDNRNIMYRDEFDPVSWPELDLIRMMHGDESIEDVKPFVRVNQEGRAERARLAIIYGERLPTECWGGKNPPRELEAPGAELPEKVTWKNPLTGRIEGELLTHTPPPTDLAETVGDMSKAPPAPVESVEEDDFGGEQAAPRSRRRG